MERPTTSTDLGREVARFVSGLTVDDLPPVAVSRAERCILDTVGVTLAGARERAGSTAVDVVGDLSRGEAAVLGTDQTASPTDAAFSNGTAGHCLDFDDISARIHVHPSVVLVPALLAAATGRQVTGAAAVTAYVAGLETMNYLVAPVTPGNYERGWHTTATVGTLGAAAAAASVLDLDRGAVEHAVNAAASTAAGLKRNFGSMVKPMHAGQAARSGLTAALLAERGFTAAAGTLRGEGGFLDLYGGEPAPDFSALPELGAEYGIVEHGVEAKRYPCCYFAHSPIAATEALVDEHAIAPGDVSSIHVLASRAARDALVHPDPATGLEAKFSLHYAVASAVARDRVGLDAFEDDNLDHDGTQRVRGRVTFEADPVRDYGDHGAVVTMHTQDGRTVSHEQETPPGSLDSPLSDEQVRRKYRTCAGRALDDATVEWTYEALSSLREQDDLGDVVARL